MGCQLHGDRPRPHLCHDCARDLPSAVRGPVPDLRITDEDRQALRIIVSSRKGEPTRIVKKS
tara:strand:- start:504 stop:689 length:186 start_codon:yes stop_codon:yes gene_type:complete